MAAITVIRRFRNLYDVTFGAPADGDTLVYDTASDKLKTNPVLYEQASDPGTVPKGSLWIDTDDSVTGGSPVVANVRDYGARGDGTTDDTAAIQAAINAGTNVVWLPAGTYLVTGLTAAGGVSGPGGTIQGVSLFGSTLKLANGANQDLLTLNGQGWRVTNLGIDGNKANNTSGNGIVVKYPRTIIDHVYMNNVPGHGLYNAGTSGQTAHANEYHNIRILNSGGDGIRVSGAYATDGRFSNVEIGQCGGYGAYVESGALLWQQSHMWGNTLDGFRANGASYQQLVQVESETNNQHGVVFVGGHGHMISGSYVWQNQGRGIYAANVDRFTVVNNQCKNNKGGPGISTDTSLYGTIIGNVCWDDFGTKLQTYGIATASSSDYMTVVGNISRAADHATGSISLVGAHNDYGHNIE